MSNPAADFPAAVHSPVDTTANATSALGETGPTHSQVHGKTESEIVAIQQKLGIGAAPASSASAREVLRVDGSGNSEWAANDEKPRPLGSRVIGLGDSIMAATTPSGQFGSAGPYTDSRPNFNAWFNRMCYANPKRFYRLRNAGIGGDVTGGYGKTTTVVTAGLTTSVTYRVTKGTKMFGVNTLYIGALDGTNDTKTPSGHVDNGDGTFTVSWSGTMVNTWPADSDIRWGMLGRLQTDVINWNPEVVFVHGGTNDLNNLTTAQIVSALMDIGTDLRAANIEPIFMELLPRSTYMSQVVQVNDALRYACRTYAGGSFHLIPIYDVFAGSDGMYSSVAYSSDGLHPSALGNNMIANLVVAYMEKLPMRISAVPTSAYDTDPVNLLQNTHFLTGSAGGGGTIPTGWTYNPFFTTNTIPSLQTPGPLDAIRGNWFRWRCTAATGTTSIRKALTSQPAVGDFLRISARVKTVGLTGGMTVTLQYLDGSFNNNLIYNLAENTEVTLFTTTARVSSANNNIFEILVTPVGGTGDLYVGEVFVQNLGPLGRTP